VAYRTCGDYLDANSCPIRSALLEVRDATAEILETRNVASMIEEPKQNRRDQQGTP
jgi:DNA-binding IscR family transcriptional regulator